MILRPPGGEPCAAGDVLGIAKLRGGDFFAAEIGGGLQVFIRLDDEGAAAIGRAGNDADFPAAGAGVGVDGGAGADIGHVDGAGEDALDGAGSGVVGIPLDGDIRAEALLEPALALPAEGVGHQRLHVGDIREMADAQDQIVRARAGERHGASGGQEDEKAFFIVSFRLCGLADGPASLRAGPGMAIGTGTWIDAQEGEGNAVAAHFSQA